MAIASKPTTKPMPVTEPPTFGRGLRPCAASGHGLLRGPPERAPPLGVMSGAMCECATDTETRQHQDRTADEKRHGESGPGAGDRLAEHAGASGRNRRC